eukprot:2454317-Pyramimonas_sp.AAC.2
MELAAAAMVHAQAIRDASALRLLQRQFLATHVAVARRGRCHRRGPGHSRRWALAVAKGNGSGRR